MRTPNKGPVKCLILATGVSSVVTQLLTIREFLAQFAGNEWTIAVIFFNWLVLGGAGTLLARLCEERRPPASPSCLAWLSLAASALPVIHLLAIRVLRDLFFTFGTQAGFYGLTAFSFFITAPYGLLIGFLLPYSLFVLRSQDPGYSGTSVYMTDNIGDVAGGALFSFVLVFWATPMAALFISGLPLLLSATWLLIRIRGLGPAPMLGAALALAVLAAGVAGERATLAPGTGELAYYKESRYGRIVVTRHPGQHTLFLDGRPVAGSHDPQAAEELAHYPLAQIDRPGRVLLISALSGLIDEVQKHRPGHIDYVELDPDVANAMFRFGLLAGAPNVTVINEDARRLLARSNRTYDAILVCLPEPDTFQLNRFYTDSFFPQARQRLSPDGVLAFAMEGFDAYVSEVDRQKLSSVHNTAARAFSHVALLPGGKTFFLCSNAPIDLDIPRRLAQKGISTTYISGYFHGTVTPQRVALLSGLIDPAAPVNTDLFPALMRHMFTRWLSLFSNSPAPFFLAAGVLLAGWLVRASPGEFVLFSNGFVHMAAEILAIFVFQIFFGYIYLQIGLLVTVFLAGLLPGAWMGQVLSWRSKKALLTLDALLVVLIGGFALLLHGRGAALFPGAYLVFGFLVSWVCGFQFAAILQRFGDTEKLAANAFSADLVGAAFGALSASIVLIPRFGVAGTAAALIVLKLAGMLMVGTHHEKSDPA